MPHKVISHKEDLTVPLLKQVQTALETADPFFIEKDLANQFNTLFKADADTAKQLAEPASRAIYFRQAAARAFCRLHQIPFEEKQTEMILKELTKKGFHLKNFTMKVQNHIYPLVKTNTEFKAFKLAYDLQARGIPE